MAAEIFIFTRHSELLFKAKNSEFRCEIKFRKSLHFYSEKLRILGTYGAWGGKFYHSEIWFFQPIYWTFLQNNVLGKISIFTYMEFSFGNTKPIWKRIMTRRADINYIMPLCGNFCLKVSVFITYGKFRILIFCLDCVGNFSTTYTLAGTFIYYLSSDCRSNFGCVRKETTWQE